jgi:pyridoxamine 5'-phosphate oxidase
MKDANSQTHLDLAAMRIDYAKRSLSEQDVKADPILQLIEWLDQAIAAKVNEPNAMTLATVEDGRPSARIMLLKGVGTDGLTFFTNYLSRKGRQMAANPDVAAVLWWPELERQVRIEGTVSRTTTSESREYFNKRPPDARLGAAASPQSQVVSSRQQLEQSMADLAREYPDGNVPCPEHWGGFRLRPSRMEFWQGRRSRLHDRIEYIRQESGWTIRRLAP